MVGFVKFGYSCEDARISQSVYSFIKYIPSSCIRGLTTCGEEDFMTGKYRVMRTRVNRMKVMRITKMKIKTIGVKTVGNRMQRNGGEGTKIIN